MFEDNIDVKIGRVLFEKQTGEELYDAAIGLKELFDQREKKMLWPAQWRLKLQ